MAWSVELQEFQQKLRDRMTPIDLREAEYALLAEAEAKSGAHYYPEHRCMVTVSLCCWIAGLNTNPIEPSVETSRLASLFKSFWLRAGRSPTMGEARAIVAMVDATLLKDNKLLSYQPGA